MRYRVFYNFKQNKGVVTSKVLLGTPTTKVYGVQPPSKTSANILELFQAYKFSKVFKKGLSSKSLGNWFSI